MKKNVIIEQLNSMKNSNKRMSAWENGVFAYAFDMLEQLDDDKDYSDYATLLNGATSFMQYSRDGFALIYNDDIAKRMCTQSEYKRYLSAGKNSKLHYSMYWIDEVQCRALYQAMAKIRTACKAVYNA